MESIGPVPWAGMLLAGMGAEVTRLRRPVAADMGIPRDARFEIQNHGKRTATADLKTPQGHDDALAHIQDAHILLEGLRPGVMERLGLGPDVCRERNPSLVYGRATGWGQSGPLAQTVGHDINYLAATGVLHAIGSADAPPTVPLNLIGDFGAGGMLLVSGVLAALVQARATGKGCVVDAAIVDGALALMAPILGRWQEGQWHDARERNLFDGGAPFYATYATADGKAVAVGAIEPRFYAALLAGLGLDASTRRTGAGCSRAPKPACRPCCRSASWRPTPICAPGPAWSIEAASCTLPRRPGFSTDSAIRSRRAHARRGSR
jgi:alpha-methylacyl-CoA racemase